VNSDIQIALENASTKSNIPYEVLYSIAVQESNLNPNAKSSKGAIGLMQLMPVIIEKYKINPYNPTENALVGAKLISIYFRNYRGNWPKILASYNWGPGNVKNNPNINNWPKNTKNYINNIMKRAKQYFALWI